MTSEKFEKQLRAHRRLISIRRNGTLSINSEAVKAFTLKEMHFATLHYDHKESVMAIKPVPDNSDPAAFRVVREKKGIYVISCQSFLNHYGIPYQHESKTFKPTWDEKTRMLLIKLQQNDTKEVRT
jgi:hypothetical protein